VSLWPLADLTAGLTPAILRSVLKEHKRLAPAVAGALVDRKIAARDRLAITRSLGALLRWWGWIEQLRIDGPAEQLLLASLLVSSELSPLALIWAAQIGRRPERLIPVGDAPNWTARAAFLKRWTAGRPVNADPWRLFPAWLKDQLPLPPGDATPKERRLSFLAALQTPAPLWVGVRDRDEKAVWAELRAAGLKPWIHRRLAGAAKLPVETDLSQIDALSSGRLVVQDLASQAVARVCDPDAGERWCDLNPESGLHALQLAALMAGRGIVVCAFERERRRREIALRLRPTGYHNIATRLWDGRHLPGKTGSYDGVLVEAVSSGVGSWRRHPDARWLTSAHEVGAFRTCQLQLLDLASKGLRPGGALVYTVATVTPRETTDVVHSFLAAHPEFALQPFPHPLEDATTDGTVLLWSHIHDADARFIARMTRSAVAERPVAGA
jgi:16S rRNA (cytosine967-C5)-methyltransferase